VDRIGGIRRLRRLVGIGAPDPSLTVVSGMVVVTELVDSLNMTKLAEVAWIPIRYPHAIYDHDEQRWVSDAEVAEVAFTAFTGRRHAEHITARGDRAPGSPAQPDPHTTGQSQLFAPYRYHAVCTDNPQPMLDAQATHRHHAIVEQVIADLKDSALAHCPRDTPTPPG
jgi:hypothetical protein